MKAPLSEEDVAITALAVLATAAIDGNDGVSHADIDAALREVGEWATAAAMLSLLRQGKVAFRVTNEEVAIIQATPEIRAYIAAKKPEVLRLIASLDRD